MSAETVAGDHLGVDGGAGLADDQPAQHARDEPDGRGAGLEAGQQRLDRGRQWTPGDAPDPEDDADGDADDTRHHNVDDSPAESSRIGLRGRGGG
jgi:hypothetical protein